MVRFRASPYAFIKVITVHDFTLVGRRKRGSLFTVAKRLPLNMGRRPAHTVQVSGGYLNGAGRLLETTIARSLTYATHLQNNVFETLQNPPKQQTDGLHLNRKRFGSRVLY